MLDATTKIAHCSALLTAHGFLAHSISGFLAYSQVYLVDQGDERRILYNVSYSSSFSCRWGMAKAVLLQDTPRFADMPCIPFVQQQLHFLPPQLGSLPATLPYKTWFILEDFRDFGK